MNATGLCTDVRFAMRGLLRHPTFTVIAIMTLALGIGANTAVFTLVDGVLLSPLPYDESEELISIRHQGREGRDELPMSTGLFLLYRNQAPAIESIALHASTSVNLFWDGEPQRVPAEAVTPGFFDVLGVEPAHGRGFLESEGAPGGAQVVILSDGLWRSSFGGDRNVLGQTLDVNGTAREIVGVMPPDFGHPNRDARLWLPFVIDSAQAPLAAFGANGIARLAPGHTVESAYAQISTLIGRLAELFPESGAPAFLAEVNLRAVVQPLKQSLVGDIESTLWILLGMVGFVLLIACANVANLLLVRAEGRQRELALRVAVGAGRMQILRAFLCESTLLAGAGAVFGILIATLALRTSIALAPGNLPRVAEIGLDLRVLGFTAAVTLGCALFFGLFPMLRYGASNLASRLHEGAARGATSGRERHRLRNALVVAQIAIAVVLLVGSGLMFRSFLALRAVDPGFEADGVLTARITVPSGEIAEWERTANFFRQLQARLAEQPGVEAAGFAQSAPLAGGLGYFSIVLEDHPRGPGELPVFASNNFTEVGYIEAMGIGLIEGRTFRSGDGAEGARAVIVTRSFAEHWWPDTSPIGRRMKLGFPNEEWYTIVGVVADAHYANLEETPEEMVYWPATSGPAASPQPSRAMDVVIKTAGDPIALVGVLRREVAALNPRIPVSNPRTMHDLVNAATSRMSFTMALLGAASGIALLLGLVGTYGVISYIVSQRTREIGVRLALGATAPSVRSMVVRHGLLLAAIGVGIGVIAAGALSSVMATILYGVSATDPITYVSVAAAMIGVTLAASWIPALRAARLDPSLALRME